ncbi:MAG: apolipoprotein N-acyltransferase [Deltaproteobacteria bacterium]|nr:apolipoprotein N-acyltransferase [Deltaproteobacteria bacterium]
MKLLSRLPLGPGPFAASALSGLFISLAFPRIDLWPGALVGLALLSLVARHRTAKAAFGCGFLAGLVHAATLVYWVFTVLVTYGGISWILAIPIFALLAGYMALYQALWTLGLNLAERKLKIRFGGWQWILIGAAIYTGLEYFKSFFLTGFPWGPLGSALYPNLVLIQAADLAGVGGLTFLVVFINLSLASAIAAYENRNLKNIVAPVLAVIVVLGLLWGYGHYRLIDIQDLTARASIKPVAIAQGSIEQSLKWSQDQRVKTMVTYRDLTFKAAKEKPWLTVWPETAAPFFYLRDQATTDWLNKVVMETGRPLLFGAPAYEESSGLTKYYNRAYLLDGQAKVMGYYDKAHLVPYGEYVPLKEYFPFISKITQAVGDYYSGQPGKLVQLDGLKIGVLICFESIFPELARTSVTQGADYLVVITNDAWFGRSSAPAQHLVQSALRAIETRRAVIRAANTGISALISPSGRIETTLDLFVRDTLTGRVSRLTEKTIYTTIGDLAPQICLGVTILIFTIAIIRRKHAI